MAVKKKKVTRKKHKKKNKPFWFLRFVVWLSKKIKSLFSLLCVFVVRLFSVNSLLFVGFGLFLLLFFFVTFNALWADNYKGEGCKDTPNTSDAVTETYYEDQPCNNPSTDSNNCPNLDAKQVAQSNEDSQAKVNHNNKRHKKNYLNKYAERKAMRIMLKYSRRNVKHMLRHSKHH